MQRASIRVIGKLLVALAFLPIVSTGQIPGGISTPTAGYLFDIDARAFRPITGFIGSSVLGDPIDLQRPVTFGFSLPDNRHALAVFENESSLTYVDFVARPIRLQAVSGTIADVASYSISPNGKNVVLVDSAHQRLQVLSGFPSSPALTLEISAPALPQGNLLRAVVNDAATAMLVTVSNIETETIYRWNRSTGFESLTPSRGVEGLTFINGTDAVFADRLHNEVFLVHDVLEKPWLQFVAGVEDGIAAPVAAASTGYEFHIASADSGTILSFAADGHLLRSQPCDCKLSRLSPIAPGTFVMTDRVNETVFVLSGTGEQARIAFIPPAK